MTDASPPVTDPAASVGSSPAAAQGPTGLLLAALDLRVEGEGCFVAGSLPGWAARIFGGQFLGQSVVAAGRSVAAGMVAHSLHATFLRPGDPAQPIRYLVTTLREGRSFATRHVVARQDGTDRYVAVVSFARPEQGLDYQPAVDLSDVPPPAVLRRYGEWMAETTKRPEDGYETAERPRPVEVRYVDPPSNPSDGPVTGPQRMWLRVPGPLPDDPLLHAAALAYASDETLIDNVMLPHGLRWSDPRLQGASLDHAMWFCRPAPADQWLLFEQTVVSTAAGRGLVRGDLYTEAGQLVATASQEGLMRLTS